MTGLARSLIVLASIIALAAPLSADEKKGAAADTKPAAAQNKKSAAPAAKKPEGSKEKTAATSRKAFLLPENVRAALSAEQSEKAAQIEKDHFAKLDAADKTVNAILTPERRKAQAEAAARALDALLNAQEKADLKAAQESIAKVQAELRDQLMELLSDEQKSQLKKQRDPGDKKARPPVESK